MITISAKGIYGLSAVLELAHRYSKEVVQVRDIAVSQEIPRHYLDQILVVLKRGGIVESTRGAKGGYRLARAPENIKILDVFSLLEGPLKIIPKHQTNQQFSFLWNKLEASIRQCLDYSLAELADEIKHSKSQYTFVI